MDRLDRVEVVGDPFYRYDGLGKLPGEESVLGIWGSDCQDLQEHNHGMFRAKTCLVCTLQLTRKILIAAKSLHARAAVCV